MTDPKPRRDALSKARAVTVSRGEIIRDLNLALVALDKVRVEDFRDSDEIGGNPPVVRFVDGRERLRDDAKGLPISEAEAAAVEQAITLVSEAFFSN